MSDEKNSIDNYIKEIDRWLPFSRDQKNRYLENLRGEVLEAIEDTENSDPNIAYGRPYEIAKGLSLSQDWGTTSSGWIIRIFAFIIDIFIIVSFCFIYLLFGLVFIFGIESDQALRAEDVNDIIQSFDQGDMETGPFLLTIVSLLFYVLGVILIYAAYFIVLEKFYSQTIGKKILRLQVVDKSGIKLTWKQSVFRNITKLPGIVEFLIFDVILGLLFIEKGQVRHLKATDILTETKIVRIKVDTEVNSSE
jgi:uncharacterized RDD family membrane protein YckC